MLPAIRPSSPARAATGSPATAGRVGGEVPITGMLGDQQAATVGQVCFGPGRRRTPTAPATSCCSTPATTIVRSRNGLLTTVCYQFGGANPVYALEGSIAVTGSAVQWLRDQLGHHQRRGAERGAGPAGRRQRRGVLRAGLLRACSRPYWRSDARGAIVGLVAVQHQRPPGPGHAGGDLLPEPRRGRGDGRGLRRAARRAEGRRRRDRQRPVHADPGRRARCTGAARWSPRPPRSGPPTRPAWRSGSGRTPTELRANWHEDRRWAPNWSEDQRAAGYAGWRKAVSGTLDWVDVS